MNTLGTIRLTSNHFRTVGSLLRILLQSLFEIVHFTACRLAGCHFNRPLLFGYGIIESSCIGMGCSQGIKKTKVFTTIDFDSFLCKLI